MFILVFIYLSLLLFKVLSAKKYIRNFNVPIKNVDQKKISILQPILSGDPQLAKTLEGNIVNFPQCEFIWLVDKKDKVAQQIVSEIKAQYPEVLVDRQLYDEAPDGVNPKIFKLEQARKLCRRDICVVLDDDTVLSKKGLAALVEALGTHQLSTGLPVYREGNNLPSKLLAQFVNNNSALTYLSVLPYMEPLSINGMCYAINRQVLDSYGGFEPIMYYLTDDLAFANHVQKNGGKICQTPFVQEVETNISRISVYMQQMHRWYLFATLLMQRQTIVTNLIITLLHGSPSLLMWSIAIDFLTYPSVFGVLIFLFMLTARWYLLLSIQKNINQRSGNYFVISVISELLQPLHLVHACLVRKIKWRTRYYRVYDNNNFVKV
ncbi:glycosyltransferase [Agarilytica rhodophyticola]|uniref:glycosyltransferase n=1 Tax=Agarilytica rhodophyticola TaxID=1737490 RepID=UPI000B3442C0|nr:glycosyltransferase [Agarilytica rhodophyticola]